MTKQDEEEFRVARLEWQKELADQLVNELASWPHALTSTQLRHVMRNYHPSEYPISGHQVRWALIDDDRVVTNLLQVGRSTQLRTWQTKESAAAEAAAEATAQSRRDQRQRVPAMTVWRRSSEGDVEYGIVEDDRVRWVLLSDNEACHA